MGLDRVRRIEEALVERLSARERERVAELVAAGAPLWRLLPEVPRSRYAIYRGGEAAEATAGPGADPLAAAAVYG
jgi:hypothetical protein